MKTDFHNDIVFYLGMDDVFLPMNYDAILKSDLDTIWDFVSSPKNLPKITPTYMNFNITSKDLI